MLGFYKGHINGAYTNVYPIEDQLRSSLCYYPSMPPGEHWARLLILFADMLTGVPSKSHQPRREVMKESLRCGEYVSQTFWLDILSPIGASKSCPLDQRVKAASLKGHTAMVIDEGKILCVIEEEPEADAKKAHWTSMVNFLILSPPTRMGREAWDQLSSLNDALQIASKRDFGVQSNSNRVREETQGVVQRMYRIFGRAMVFLKRQI